MKLFYIYTTNTSGFASEKQRNLERKDGDGVKGGKGGRGDKKMRTLAE